MMSSNPYKLKLSSEPSSPTYGVRPRWLKTPRSVGSARYVLKMLGMALVCVGLGVSVSGLYKGSPNRVHHAFTTNSESLESDTNPTATQSNLENDSPPIYLGQHDPTYSSHRNQYFEEEKQTSEGKNSFLERLSEWGRNKIKNRLPKDMKNINADERQSPKETKETFTDPLAYLNRTLDGPSILAKVSIVTGGGNSVYERALRTHNAHNRLHDYPMYVLRNSILDDVWSKPAYILSIMLRELAKPEHERVKWLFWFDADTIIINPNLPLEIFLPPQSTEWDDVHILVCHDYNGLNNGVFPLRVHRWSVDLLSSVIAYRSFKSNEPLKFRDQSALENLLEMPKFKRHSVQAPQRWFNAYQGEINETIAPFQTRPGDLLVHFAGVPNRDERMDYWLERAEEHLPEWEIDLRHTSFFSETRDFWAELHRKRRGDQKEIQKLQEKMRSKCDMLRETLTETESEFTPEDKEQMESNINKVMTAFEDDDTKRNLDSIEDIIMEMERITEPLQVKTDKKNRELLRDAHQKLLDAEAVMLKAEPNIKEMDIDGLAKDLNEKIDSLKDTLVEKEFSAGPVKKGMEQVEDKKKEVEARLEEFEKNEDNEDADKKAEEERKEDEKKEDSDKKEDTDTGEGKAHDENKPLEDDDNHSQSERKSVKSEQKKLNDKIPSNATGDKEGEQNEKAPYTHDSSYQEPAAHPMIQQLAKEESEARISEEKVEDLRKEAEEEQRQNKKVENMNSEPALQGEMHVSPASVDDVVPNQNPDLVENDEEEPDDATNKEEEQVEEEGEGNDDGEVDADEDEDADADADTNHETVEDLDEDIYKTPDGNPETNIGMKAEAGAEGENPRTKHNLEVEENEDNDENRNDQS